MKTVFSSFIYAQHLEQFPSLVFCISSFLLPSLIEFFSIHVKGNLLVAQTKSHGVIINSSLSQTHPMFNRSGNPVGSPLKLSILKLIISRKFYYKQPVLSHPHPSCLIATATSVGLPASNHFPLHLFSVYIQGNLFKTHVTSAQSLSMAL